MKHETASNDPAIRVLKTAKCKSLSGESELTYQIGCGSGSDSEIHFRVVGNTAAGAFNQDWVSLDAIRKAFAKAPGPQEITSSHLHRLYAHRSVNTPAFLLAALRHEGLVRPSKTKRRRHECADEASIVAATSAWLAAGDAPKAESTKGAKQKPSVAVTKHVPSEAKKGDPLEITKSVPAGVTKSVPPKVASGVPSKAKPAVPQTSKPKEPRKGKAR